MAGVTTRSYTAQVEEKVPTDITLADLWKLMCSVKDDIADFGSRIDKAKKRLKLIERNKTSWEQNQASLESACSDFKEV